MTYSESVQHIWTGLNDEDARRLLWSVTCFPFGQWKTIEAQLREKYEQSGGDVERAIEIAHEETDAAMEALREAGLR